MSDIFFSADMRRSMPIKSVSQRQSGRGEEEERSKGENIGG